MQRLLIIADLEGKSQVALERGLLLAQKMRCEVDVVGFCHEYLGAAGIKGVARQEEARSRLLAKRKRDVAAHIKRLKPAGVKVHPIIIWEKSIHEWIEKHCKSVSYQAVIKTSHSSASFHYTSTDWHLLRSCPAPVMIVAEKKWRRTKPVLAAIDLGSKSKTKRALNDDIITTAKHYSEVLGCKLHILYAVHISPVLTELDLVDDYTHAEEVKAALQPDLERLSKMHDIPLRAFNLKQGPADKVITSEAARLKAQLVIMGTSGRKGVRARLLGNMAEQVLETLHTDVLALKP